MIFLELAWDAVFNALAAVVMAAFGVWVLTIQPRTRTTRMLALFAISYGVLYVFVNLLGGYGLDWLNAFALGAPLYLAAAWGAFWVGHEILGGAGDKAGTYRRAFVVTVASVAFAVALDGSFNPVPVWGAPLNVFLVAAVVILANSVFLGAVAALPFALALLFRGAHGPEADKVRHQAILVSAAMVLWPGLYFGYIAYARFVASAYLEATLHVLAGVALGLVWLSNARISPAHSRSVRNLALLIVALPLLALVLEASFGRDFSPSGSGPHWGVARLAGVAILGYAILRHQVFGLDVKARWAISKTTVAGVFISAFFLASEVGQQFFGEQFGSTYVGIAAAGVLVFAIAPLQQAAERLAAKAVPPAAARPGVAPQRESEVEEVFASAVRLMLRDRHLSREEEVHLHRLAEVLGIRPARAHAILAETEARETTA